MYAHVIKLTFSLAVCGGWRGVGEVAGNIHKKHAFLPDSQYET